jgi:molybdate transport system ATP-binding protein
VSLSAAVAHTQGDFSLDIAFEAPTPGVTALFGSSGAGKSSTMAAIAGLIPRARTRLVLDGQALHMLPPEARGIGMVFQDGLLFPHMSVAANLRYGMRRTGRRGIGFAETVELLGIGALLNRRPLSLSGGERQRVAIGRALLSQPRLLLMDEPLASLDQPRRAEILPYLGRVRSVLKIPIIYASHALDESLAIADTLVLITHGRVTAAGPVARLTAQADLPLALRDDATGILHGTISAHDPGRRLTTVACGPQTMLVPLLDLPEESSVRLLIAAREVILARDAPTLISVNNVFPAIVQAIADDPGHHAALVTIDGGGGPLLARVTLDAARRLDLRCGEPILALVKSMSVDVLKA